MLEAIGTGVQKAIEYTGQVVTAVVTTEGGLSALLPVVGLAIGMGGL